MFKTKFGFKNLFVVFSLIGALVWLAVFSFPDNRLHLVFCDVGQGDAVLISKGFEQILIDGGPNDKVLQCLSNNMPFFDKTIEIVALTHPEADHLTGLISVLDKYRVDWFLAGPVGNESAVYQSLSTKLQGNKALKIKIFNPYQGEKIKLGEVELDTLWPEETWVRARVNYETASVNYGEGVVLGARTIHTKLNDFSLVFLLGYKDKKVLLMGDADSRVQDKILQAISNWQLAIEGIEILKFPHHGSKTGMTEDFLQKIKPKEAVISVGKNSFGHPTQEALDLLKKYQVKVRRTDLEGEIKYIF